MPAGEKRIEPSRSLLLTAPDEYAKFIMQAFGYYACVAGEVEYIYKCKPIEAKLIPDNQCYKELPVNVSGNAVFMRPRTKILTNEGNKIRCSNIAPNMYKLDDVWIEMNPYPKKVESPQIFDPEKDLQWRYTDLDKLVSTGLYSSDDIQAWRDNLNFPGKEKAFQYAMAQAVIDGHSIGSKYRMDDLLNMDIITQAGERVWNRMWGSFKVIGDITSGMLGLWVTFKLLEFLIDSILHGMALHSLYGWSFVLLGACWDSVTAFFLTLKKEATKTTEKSESPSGDVHSCLPRASQKGHLTPPLFLMRHLIIKCIQ
ncbi:hypothetical protein QAD02_009386 [Eretmocerus hayati]|uniref:Uncharacterized protein n=1 Tax=Eretmocerus hayati TaxID=131215 RepID=A0ACC2N9W8_9HYME|nr:hypothetical protein QAD02_009386 [Eretmocerus hayati]